MTCLARAACTTLVLSRQSIQLTRNTLVCSQMMPLESVLYRREKKNSKQSKKLMKGPARSIAAAYLCITSTHQQYLISLMMSLIPSSRMATFSNFIPRLGKRKKK